MTLKCQCHQTFAYSPELNPIEQVWRWLRQHYLANQYFTDYDDIISKVCDA
ncbi:transposase [Vibrio parahaemolyticus]|uniref:transposase n=1 Tax=Vibrio parahaemolyticus TaxID=670 RepID=UPI0040564C4F